MAAPQGSTVDETELEDDPNYVVVELGPKFQNRIFHEFDDGHPGGEALVVNGRRVRVRYTTRVREALGSGLLVMSRKPATPRPPDMAELLEDNRQATALAEATALARSAADLASAAADTANAAGGTAPQAGDGEDDAAGEDASDGDPPAGRSRKKASS